MWDVDFVIGEGVGFFVIVEFFEFGGQDFVMQVFFDQFGLLNFVVVLECLVVIVQQVV